MALSNDIRFPQNLSTFPRFIEIKIKSRKFTSEPPKTNDATPVTKPSGGKTDMMTNIKNATVGLGTGINSGLNQLDKVASLKVEPNLEKTIYLPLPNTLSTDFIANWNGHALSPMEYAIRELSRTGGNWNAAGQAMGERMVLSGLEFFSKKGGNAVGISGQTVAAAGGGLLAGARILANPFQQLLYSGPSFRTFSFDWVLSPENAAEAETIREITWYLKKYMHTSSSVKDLFFTFPAYCEIKFLDNSLKELTHLFAIRECAITRVNVQYERKFHKDGASIATRLSVDLLESVILTQEDFGKTYKPASNGGMDLQTKYQLQDATNPTSKK